MTPGDAPGFGTRSFGHGPPALVEVRREGDRTTIVVWASVHPTVKTIVVAWLGAWAAGELLAVRFAIAAGDAVLPFFQPFALAFLAGWTAMGALAAYVHLWCREGTEEVSTDGLEVAFRRQVRGLGLTRRFPAARVRGPTIRYDGRVASIDQVSPDALVRLAFDAGGSTVRLGSSVRHADALRVAAAFSGAAPRAAGRSSASSPRR